MPRKQEETGSAEEAKSFLTKRQVQVLQFRLQGLTQQEIADLMGTTRANICKMERRAHQNVMMARRTLREWMKIQAPIVVSVPAGTDVLRVPSMIFKAADMEGIHLPVNAIDIIIQLRIQASFLFRKQAVLDEKHALPTEVEIFINHEGQILLIDEAV
jgi:HTH-type transcriptional regulator, fmd operon transcriptional regulator